MADADCGKKLVTAGSDFVYSVGAAAMDFWQDLKKWFSSLHTAIKVILLGLLYFTTELIIDLISAEVIAGVNDLLSSISGLEFTITGLDLIFFSLYLLVLIMYQNLLVMRKVNKLAEEVEHMAEHESRTDGGRIREHAGQSIAESPVVFGAIAGFILGLPFGYSEAFAAALTGAVAGSMFGYRLSPQ